MGHAHPFFSAHCAPGFKNSRLLVGFKRIITYPFINTKDLNLLYKSLLILNTKQTAERLYSRILTAMISTLLTEEAYRHSKDDNTTLQLKLLDAKAAFDTVIHSHLLRKVYLAGIDDKHWTLIKGGSPDSPTPQ